MLAGRPNLRGASDGCEMRLGNGSDACYISTIICVAQRCDLSFSWYCRLPAADTLGAAVRRGEAILGLAAVASTRPAWAGTAAATLLNMAKRRICVFVVVLSVAINWLQKVVDG